MDGQSLKLAGLTLSPGGTTSLTLLPWGSTCWSGLHADVYPCSSLESDIWSSFILCFPGLDVSLPTRLVRNMLTDSTWCPLLLFGRQFMSDFSWPHGLLHDRPPCLSPSPRVCPSSHRLNRWCHPTISSSVTLFSFCLQSFPASGSFIYLSVNEPGGFLNLGYSHGSMSENEKWIQRGLG